jgi:hypothetical protein
LKRTTKFLRAFVACLFLAGCAVTSGGSGGGSSGSGGSSGGSGSSGGTNEPGGDSQGFTFASTDFYVDVNAPANTTMTLHVNGDWTQPCKASASDPNQDLVCFLEVEEADLYNEGLTFNYQVPNAQCAYLTFNPYYYYQFQAGAPATVVNETITDGVITSVTGTGGDAGTACGGQEVCLNPGGELTCAFDYSTSGQLPAGPNCCEGAFTFNVTTVTTGSPNTVNTTQSEWSGQASNCLNGPAVVSQPKDTEGYPEILWTFVNDETINDTYVVAPPIKQTFRGSNVYASNYWGGPYTITETNPFPPSAPLAFWPNNPNWAGLTTNARQAQPWYEWGCMDEAGDYVNRIRVLVRSWSEASQFAAQGISGVAGPQGIPFSDHDLLNWQTWLVISDPSTGGNRGFGNTYPGYSN